jgi:hypothetical protein
MKKVLIAAALVFTTGMVSLYIKQASLRTVNTAIQLNLFDNNKELASGD